MLLLRISLQWATSNWKFVVDQLLQGHDEKEATSLIANDFGKSLFMFMLGVPPFCENSLPFFCSFLKGDSHDHGNPGNILSYPGQALHWRMRFASTKKPPQLLHPAGAGSLWYAPPELNPPVEVDENGGGKDRVLRKLATVLRGVDVEVQMLMKMKDTLQGTNISHLGKRKTIFKSAFWWDMLIPRRVRHFQWKFMLCKLKQVVDWGAKCSNWCITYCVRAHKKVTS